MKRLSLAAIIVIVSISLVGCTNSGEVSNSNNQSSVSNVSSSNNSNTTNKITIEQAQEIALKHAGLTKDQVSFIKIENDIDNGLEKYDIEFYCNGKEYDYEINAANGQIIKYDYDIEDNYITNNNINNTQINEQSNVNNTAKISVDRAKEIALSHAGLTSSEVNFKRTELDFDNGIQKYEVEFYYNYIEYSYEIDANTGVVLSYEQD